MNTFCIQWLPRNYFLTSVWQATREWSQRSIKSPWQLKPPPHPPPHPVPQENQTLLRAQFLTDVHNFYSNRLAMWQQKTEKTAGPLTTPVAQTNPLTCYFLPWVAWMPESGVTSVVTLTNSWCAPGNWIWHCFHQPFKKASRMCFVPRRPTFPTAGGELRSWCISKWYCRTIPAKNLSTAYHSSFYFKGCTSLYSRPSWWSNAAVCSWRRVLKLTCHQSAHRVQMLLDS